MKLLCPMCNVPMTAADNAGGQTVKCPTCAHAFVAPAAPKSAEVVGGPPPAGRKACPLCAASVAVDATKCPTCKGTIGTVTCPACKEKAPIDAALCPHCGTGLRPVQPVVGSITAGQAMIQPSNPPKSPLSACLLSFLICCIPFGHFYIGQTMKGLVWIGISVFTGGVGSIVAAVDAYMCAKKLERGQPIGEMEFFPS